MKKVDLLFLSQEDVTDLGLTMQDAIDIVEDVLREHALKQVENPPKPGVHPLPDAFIHAMPGYLSGRGAVGLKWVSRFSSNQRLGLPAVMGLIVLNDTTTGQPMAVMDCRWVTAMRTGAASAVAAKYLARKDAQVVGIVGAGTQGRYNLLALNQVLPGLRLAKVFDVNREATEDLITSMSPRLRCEIQLQGSAQEAIAEADVVVTATGELQEPIFKEHWVAEGSLVLPVHHRGWENEMLHAAEKFVTDDWQQIQNAHREVGGFYGPLPDLHAELGEIVIGQKPGRETPTERIIDFNYGLAIEDVGMAQAVFERAVEVGAGTRLTLMRESLPLM